MQDMLRGCMIYLFLAMAWAVPCRVDQSVVLSRVNDLRLLHSAPPVMWHSVLQLNAEAWSETMADADFFEHSDSPFGENLAIGYASGGLEDATNIVMTSITLWYNEVVVYDYNLPKYKANTGHFTQLVWAATQRIGVGVVRSPLTNKVYVTMVFDPPGNVGGAFKANVFPPIGGIAAVPSPRPPSPPPKPVARATKTKKKPVTRRLLLRLSNVDECK